MKKTVYKNFYFIMLFILLLMLDRITKNLAISYLKDKEPFEIIKNVLEFHYLNGGNTGAAWGILQGKTVFFYIITAVVLMLIIAIILRLNKITAHIYLNKIESLYKTAQNCIKLQIVFVFLASGAAGNLIDRIIYGYVIDFIYFKLIDFPIFNVADCYITISVILIIIMSLFMFKTKEADMIFSTKPVDTVLDELKDDNNA